MNARAAICCAAIAVVTGAHANPERDRMFLQAAEEGDAAVVARMLEQGQDINAVHEQHTALTKAASKGHTALVRQLIAGGAKVQDAGFVNVLADPVRYGRVDTLRLLVDSGADVNYRNAISAPAIWYAALYAQEESVRYLLSKGARVDAVHQGRLPIEASGACRDPRTFRLLTEAGSDLRHRTADGETVLFCAVPSLDPALVRYAICHGADPSARNGKGQTAADVARKMRASHAAVPRSASLSLPRIDTIISLLEGADARCADDPTTSKGAAR